MKRLAMLLVTLAPLAVAAQTQGVSKDEIVVGTIQDLSGPLAALGTHFRNSLQMRFDEVNAGFARVEQIKRFSLIEQKLTAEDEELTPTMKLKRKLVNEKYKSLIESMYAQRAAA